MGNDRDEERYGGPYSDWYDLKPDYSGLSKELREAENLKDDPYWEQQKSSHGVKEHRDSEWVMEQHRQEAVRIKESKRRHAMRAKEVKTYRAETVPGRFPVRIFLCVLFLIAALCSVFLAYGMVQKKWDATVENAFQRKYEEKETGKVFQAENGSRVTLEEQAYTLVEGEKEEDFPLQQKLIGIYLKVDSDSYREDGDSISNVYLGYETPEGMAYTRTPWYGDFRDYLEELGFDRDSCLSLYRLGNGRSGEGFCFFYVPRQTDRITVYLEQRAGNEEDGDLHVVYHTEMEVLPEDGELTEELAERKAAG